MVTHIPPRLSVVVATAQPWPEARICLDSLHQQAAGDGVEVILADGTGSAMSEEAVQKYPEVKWLRAPGASIFQLRALAVSRTLGDVVAITEDHCRVAPDWCERILDAHRRHPDAAVISGVVRNAAAARIVDWASFFLVNGASMPEVNGGHRNKVSLQANISYKRRVIPQEIPRLDRMEWMFNQELHSRGEKLLSDPRILVDQVESVTFRQACSLHFHDSRAVAGFQLEHLGAGQRLLRLAACAVLPPHLFLRTVWPILRKRRFLGRLVLSLPMIAVLAHCRAAGTFLGFYSGPGDSPLRIH